MRSAYDPWSNLDLLSSPGRVLASLQASWRPYSVTPARGRAVKLEQRKSGFEE